MVTIDWLRKKKARQSAVQAGQTHQLMEDDGMPMPRSSRWPTMFSGLRGITRADVPREISAGITLAALIIPLNIGYAQVAGFPPVFGLYAGIIPLAIFALFTSSPHVVGSPDAPISAIVGAMLIGFAPIGDPLRMQYALASRWWSGTCASVAVSAPLAARPMRLSWFRYLRRSGSMFPPVWRNGKRGAWRIWRRKSNQSGVLRRPGLALNPEL